MEIRRKVKNVVYKYSEAERLVREATSNDPWGPSTTMMSQIADFTHNYNAVDDIMQLIWKRLNDKGKNWRHVYKSLVLLEYLIKCGDDRVTTECRANIHTIQTLKDFQHFEEHKDHGVGVREKSKHLVSLLSDKEMLDMEKEKGKKVKEKFHKPNSALGSHQPRRPGELGREIKKQHNRDSHQRSVMKLNFDEAPRNDDDDADFQRAIELSKEEHEQTLRKKMEEEKHEELKLKFALEQSKKEEEILSVLKPPPKTNTSKSTVPDLEEDAWMIHEPQIAKLTEASRVFHELNGNLSGLDEPPNNRDPWGSSMPSTNQSKPGQLPSNQLSLDFDPWAHNVPTTAAAVESGGPGSQRLSGEGDIWSNNQTHKLTKASSRTIIDDIFGDEKPNVQFGGELQFDSDIITSGNTDANHGDFGAELFDPWTNSNAFSETKIKEPRNVNTGSLASLNDLTDYMPDEKMVHSLSVMDLANKKQKTPQEFLGENAKLVNLENLVPVPKAGVYSDPYSRMARNPFGGATLSSTATPRMNPNPFGAGGSAPGAQQQRVPMNQMSSLAATGSGGAGFQTGSSSLMLESSANTGFGFTSHTAMQPMQPMQPMTQQPIPAVYGSGSGISWNTAAAPKPGNPWNNSQQPQSNPFFD